jgi:hypothetical protein
MVLGQVVPVEPGLIVGPNELQPIRVLLDEVGLRPIHVVENTELQVVLLSTTLGSLTHDTRRRRRLRSGKIEARTPIGCARMQ